MDQKDVLVQAYARLNVHELVLERMLGHWLAAVPKQDADAFLDQFIDAINSTYVAGEPSVEDVDAHKILAGASILGNHFAEKVRHLADELRE